jgi:hypothetical protein
VFDYALSHFADVDVEKGYGILFGGRGVREMERIKVGELGLYPRGVLHLVQASSDAMTE